MVAVDLVPAELKVSWQRKKRLKLWLTALLLTVCAAGLWSGLAYLTYVRAKQSYQMSSDEYRRIQSEIESASAAQNQLVVWQSRIVLLDALRRYPDYVRIMQYLTDHSPEHVYLEKIKLAQAEPAQSQPESAGSVSLGQLPKGATMFNLLRSSAPTAAEGDSRNGGLVTMHLQGRALNHQVVADYLARLRSAPWVTRAQLQRSERQISDSSQTIDFKLECTFLPWQPILGIKYADKQKAQNL